MLREPQSRRVTSLPHCFDLTSSDGTFLNKDIVTRMDVAIVDPDLSLINLQETRHETWWQRAADEPRFLPSISLDLQ